MGITVRTLLLLLFCCKTSYVRYTKFIKYMQKANGVPGPIHRASIVWTTHATDRLRDRRMTKDLVESVLVSPDYAQVGRQSGTFEYGKQLGSKSVTAIVKKNNEGKAIIISCWMDPPEHGTADWKEKKYYLQYRHAKSIWGQLWILLKRQLGA